MISKVLNAIEADNLVDFYQEIVTFSTDNLKILVKPRKDFIGFGKICGFYMYWIALSDEGEPYFKARKSFSPKEEDNKVKIEFKECNRDEIFAAITEIYNSYLRAMESGQLPQIKEECQEYRNSLRATPKKIRTEGSVNGHVVSLWNELTTEVYAKLNIGDSYTPPLSAEEQERLRKTCERLELIFDGTLDTITNIYVTYTEFQKNLYLYRKYIDNDSVTLADIGQELGVTRERVRQKIRKTEKIIGNETKRAVRYDNDDINRLIESLHAVLKCVDFDIISLYLFGSPNVGKRKRNAIIEAFWGKNTAETVYSIASDYFERLRLQDKESDKKERLRLELEEFRAKICFPSSEPNSVPIPQQSNNALLYQYERIFYTKIKKFDSLIDIGIAPDIIYYSSATSDYRPQLLIRFPDGSSALILIVPTLNMAYAYNVNRFNQLHIFCKQNGYGYLITDERGNSIFDLQKRALDNELTRLLREPLERVGAILWEDVKKIKALRSVSNADLAAFVLQNKLYFSPQPYTIKHRPK